MTVSLRARLFLAHGLLLAAALAAVTVIETTGQRDWLIERNRESLERVARHLARDLAADAARRSKPAPDWPAIAWEQGDALGYRVTLIDAEGRVIGDTDVPRERLASLENHAGRPEVRAALSGRGGWAVRHSQSVGQDLLYVAMPAPGSAARGPAVVRVAEPLTAIARVNGSLLRLSIAAASLTLLGIGVLLFWITGGQAARVRGLEVVAARIGGGDPAARAREQPDDSLGRLGGAINRMAAELRARLQAAEHERNERELILAHMSDGAALVDSSGRVIHMNHGMAAIFGAPRPADPGTPLAEFVRSPELDALSRRARDSDRPVETDLRLWTPRPRVVHATATALPGSDRAIVLVLHDLTEVETLNRVRQDFVANVSHELRTPLTSVRGYAETLLDGGLEDRERREGFVRTILDQAGRLEALVADLLSLAELERPDARLEWGRFDLRDAVERQVASFRDKASRSGLRLGLDPGPPLEVEADRSRLEQVIANLVDNAIKYTERGEVVVRLGGDEARVWCEVADTGSGIAPEDQPRIFERFYRVDRGRARAQGGTGLGLSIVKHIVALHHGEVTVRSEPGKGSAFRFEIPRRPQVRSS